MSSIIHQLASQNVWEEFLAHRLKKGRLNWNEFEEADDFVASEEYLPVVRNIAAGGSLSAPRKRIINKIGTQKKRVVYTYSPPEMTTLKVLAHLLYKYDTAFAPNSYAFRHGLRASDAVTRVYRQVRGRRMWAYKLDIRNYFNSISVPILLPKLAHLLTDDKPLYQFFERMLCNDRAEYEGKLLHEPHGVMAGVPTASFLANLYLSDMDYYFYEQGIVYARYSDDIIIFAEDFETLQRHKATVRRILNEHKLEINTSKERVFSPEEPYEFLGFKCDTNRIDIGEGAICKIKAKIRRKMRSILRRKQRRGFSTQKAMQSMIEIFNHKLYDSSDSRTLSWSRWYFPIITSSEGLHIIDNYLQQCIRVLSTGRHTKANYRVSYDELKSLGYKSLVHEYYAFRSTATM